MAHKRGYIDYTSNPVRHYTESKAVLAVEPSTDGAVTGVILVHRDGCEIPCPESSISIFLKILGIVAILTFLHKMDIIYWIYYEIWRESQWQKQDRNNTATPASPC
jgi:hypothetical protein